MLGFQELFINFETTSLVRSSYLFDEIPLTLPFSSCICRQTEADLLGLMPPPAQRRGPTCAAEAEPSAKGAMPGSFRLLSIQLA